ncbi:hypothetical protein ACFWXT_29595 [Bacillus cereus]|uniref:hypothetical protein n=1 Tax=Bacillus cereus TaxID=1396 RepID=UPI00366DF521
MSYPIEPMTQDEKRSAANLWEVGYENLIDSMRRDQKPIDRAEMAQAASLFLMAAQVKALIDVKAHLTELVDEQRKANAIAAYGSPAVEDVSEYKQARAAARAVLGLTTETVSPATETKEQ